ncbi:hypothetical protein [Psychromonas sp.]|uniref:hypothetical protein n=1 Tax=Psychromonas sp. TaxID=1884585 RepID=UPI003561CFD3
MKKFPAKHWVFIVVVIMVYIVPKLLSHSDFVKYYGIDSKAIESISITSFLNKEPSDFIEIEIASNEQYNFKDLVLSCDFKGESNSSIEVAEYPTYQVFANLPLYQFRAKIDYPVQAYSVSCQAISLVVIAKKSCFQGLNEDGVMVEKGCEMMDIRE